MLLKNKYIAFVYRWRDKFPSLNFPHETAPTHKLEVISIELLNTVVPKVIRSISVFKYVLPSFVSDIEFPEKRKLRFMEKVPHPQPGQRLSKMMKQLIDMRGPELTHTFLLHKQYGIRVSTVVYVEEVS